VNTVTGANGFTVDFKFAGGVLYRDGKGEVRIDSEWLVNSHRVILYKRRFEKMSGAFMDNMFSNVVRALEYMGHPVEVWSNDDGS